MRNSLRCWQNLHEEVQRITVIGLDYTKYSAQNAFPFCCQRKKKKNYEKKWEVEFEWYELIFGVRVHAKGAL